MLTWIKESSPIQQLKQMPILKNGKEYDYVDAGLGRESDLESLDLTGKVALIKRGEITFSDKVANVYKRSDCALIYNSVEGANVKMGLEGDARKIPAVFISKRYGEAIKDKRLQDSL